MLLMELTNSVRNRITFFLDINIIEEICFGQKLRIKICDFKECSPDKKYSFNIICSTQRVISTSIWRKLILYYEFNLLKSSRASPLGKWMWQNIRSLRFHAVSLVPHIPNGFKGWLRKPWQPKETGSISSVHTTGFSVVPSVRSYSHFMLAQIPNRGQAHLLSA